MATPSRTQTISAAGFPTTADTRQGSRFQTGWTSVSIAPNIPPVPPGFLTPEEVAKQSTPIAPTKLFTPADFMTTRVPLNDPKLAARAFSGVPQTAPVQVGASIGVNQNIPVPAFLTNAVNQLNAAQSMQASMQENFRQQLLDAVLSGNYLAAEALRATGVSPGANVTFGNAVQNPQVGQAALVGAGAQATQAQAVAKALEGGTKQQKLLEGQLASINRNLGELPASTIIGGAPFGQQRAGLTSQQIAIQQQLQNLQKVTSKPTIVANSGYLSPSYF